MLPRHKTLSLVLLFSLAFASRFLVHSAPPKNAAASSSSPNSAPAGAHLTYYGGRVISNVKVCVVFWTSSVNSLMTTKIGGFYSDITNSSYLDLLNEYSTPGGTNQIVSRGSFVSAIFITPASSSHTVHDSAIQAELAAQITSHVLPAPSTDSQGYTNTIYMVYFPPGYTIVGPNGTTSCVAGGFCGYHSTFVFNTHSIAYGVMPDFYPGSGCAQGCGTSANAFDNLTSESSNLLAATITDPDLGLATSATPGPPVAWYDANNGEIGDICTTQSTAQTYNGHTWIVQSAFSNGQNNCVYAPSALPPAPATSITVTNGDVTVSLVPISRELYQLQRTASLVSGPWADVGTPVPASSAPNKITLSDQGGATSVTQRFYRVSVGQSSTQAGSAQSNIARK
jgi:hypothetical protein